MKPPLPDAADRARAEAELGCNFAVEAGAGSGKTTTIVMRVAAMVEAGIGIDQLAVVTFTRAAAGELRGRIVEEIDKRRRSAAEGGDAERVARFASALVQLDSAYVGTIHGFCARLLRERPVEARLDPDFVEVEGEAWRSWVQRWLREWRDAQEANGDIELAALRRLRIPDPALVEAFATLVDEPDVEFDAVPVALPAVEAVEEAFHRVLHWARTELLPHIPLVPHEKGRDTFQKCLLGVVDAGDRAMAMPAGDERRLAQLLVLERVAPGEWKPGDSPQLVDRVADALGDVTGVRWNPGLKKAQIEGWRQAFAELCAREAVPQVQALRAHRHALAMTALLRARAEFADERRQTGRLGFADLLVRAAELLRTNASARAALGARFTRLIVDEFQDTDPVQAEICFLLTAPDDASDDWRTVCPLPGRLFVVGDPKQSIYRFRRADLAVYVHACSRIVATGGAQLRFTANFRSVASVGRFVDAHFRRTFAPRNAGAPLQATFAELNTRHPDHAGSGVAVRVHEVKHPAQGAVSEDASDSAAAIAARVALGADTLDPSEILVLAPRHRDVQASARALAALGVPVAADGLGDDEAPELRELLIIVEALLAPSEGAIVVAALQGPAAGASLAELLEARVAGVSFSAVAPSASLNGTVGDGLRTLHRWWASSAIVPADILLARILDETGLLAWAASGALGGARVGKLLALLDAVREGGRDLALAKELLEARQDREAVAARPLIGAGGAVRVMTVHGSKGLEAELVHVVGPAESTEDYRAPRSIVSREATGQSRGIVPLRHKGKLIGAPANWDALLPSEAAHAADERDRLRYVAVTRAKHELRLSLARKMTKEARLLETFAEPFDTELLDPSLARPLPAAEHTATPLPTVQLPTEALRALVRAPAFRVASVTAVTASTAPVELAEDDATDAEPAVDLESYLASDTLGVEQGTILGNTGMAWGRCVHRAIEGALRGRTGSNLDAFMGAVVAAEFPLLDATAHADKLTQLRRALEHVRTTPAWTRLTATPNTALAELGVFAYEPQADGLVLVESGVVDAAVLDADGWCVVDWKTTGATQWDAKRAAYERQVAQYARRLVQRHEAPAQPLVVRVAANNEQASGAS